MNRITTGIVSLLLASCSTERAPANTGVYMLLDTSGTYRQELDRAEQIIRYTIRRRTRISPAACCRLSSS